MEYQRFLLDRKVQQVRSLLAFITLCGVFQPLTSTGQPSRVFLKDLAHPVVAGEAWLVADRWGAYPAVLVATIGDGKLDARQGVEFPKYWEQAFDYKILLAIADQPVSLPTSLVQDFVYSTSARPQYLEHFSTIYISPPLAAAKLGTNWPTALEQIGHLSGSDLILPPPKRREIRLLYPDGRPLQTTQVPVTLYGSNENHCGVAVGIPLGIFSSNADGELSFVATNSALALSIQYFELSTNGPAGKTFSLEQDVIIGREPIITVSRLWTLPEHEYVLRLRTANNQPIAQAHLTACMNFDGCGAGCGPIRAPKSDVSGQIRFRAEDLRQMRSITVVSAQGKKRDLTDSEMRELLLTYQVNLRWD
jgi:hypothetical protein